MLNLVVKPTIHVVIKRMGRDVARSEYLSLQEIHLGFFCQNGHAFVVRGKGHTEVEAKEGLMDKDKDYPLPEIQLREDQAEVEDVVQDNH